MGKLVFQVTGAFAEFERTMIRQRVNVTSNGGGGQIRLRARQDPVEGPPRTSLACVAYGGHDEITAAVRAPLCGAATLFRDREHDVTAQLVVGDSKNIITLARSSADVSPPYGFMLLPGTTSSGFAMKRSSFSLFHTKSAPFMALE